MRWLLALVLCLVACSAQPDWPMGAARAHAEADRLIDRGDRAGARAVLEELAKAPPAMALETRQVVLADTYYRLARLSLDDGQRQDSLRYSQQGLDVAAGNDLFTANLLVVQGAACEALGKNAEALSSYQRALHINEALLQQTLGKP